MFNFDEIWYGISRDIGASSGVCENSLSDKKILKFLFVEIEQNVIYIFSREFNKEQKRIKEDF